MPSLRKTKYRYMDQCSLEIWHLRKNHKKGQEAHQEGKKENAVMGKAKLMENVWTAG